MRSAQYLFIELSNEGEKEIHEFDPTQGRIPGGLLPNPVDDPCIS